MIMLAEHPQPAPGGQPPPPPPQAPRWTCGPWAGCYTAGEVTGRVQVLNRRWWNQGGWLIYLYYRITDPTLPALCFSLTAFTVEPEL